MSKPFFFRIDAAALMDFATDPEGEGISLLKFAKELQKGKSDLPFIQNLIEEASGFIGKKSDAGKKGMAKRWGNKDKTPNNTVITKNNIDITNDNTPVTSSSNRKENNYKEKEVVTPSAAKIIDPPYSREFEAFWQKYPNKTGKGKAWESWLKVKSFAYEIMSALEWQIRSEAWTKEGGKYVPMPTTYLNQRRWEDSPPVRSISTGPRGISATKAGHPMVL